jgi:hypothetical protein
MKHVRLWSLAIVVVLILGLAPQPAALWAAQIASPQIASPQTASPSLPTQKALSTPELIEAARASGEIDQDTAYLYLAYALGDYTKLPERYRSDVPWRGTQPLRRLQEAVKTMALGFTRTAIESALLSTRCNNNFNVPNTTSSTHFYIEYGSVGGGLDLADYIDSLETTWTTEIDGFGWAAPPVLPSNPPPGNLYNVLIANLSSGLYGFVSSSGDHAGLVGDNPNTTWNDVDAYATCMVLNQDYSGLGGQAGLDATTAHEFNHSIQYGYGALNGTNTPDIALVEGGATWMEDEVYDYSNDNYNYLWPDFTLCMGQYPSSSSPYSYWITFRGMVERYGTGVVGGSEQVMQDFWEETSKNTYSNLAALNAALNNQGNTLADAYHSYAVAVKFNKPCREGYVYPYCLEEGPDYVTFAGATTVHGSVGAIGSSYAGSLADNYALNWISLPTTGPYDVILKNTSEGGQLRASVVCDTGSALNVFPLPAVVGSGSSSTLTYFDPTGCSSVVAVLTNQSQTADNPTSCTARSYQLSVESPTTPDFSIDAKPVSLNVCASADAVYTVTMESANGYAGPVALSVAGVPGGASPSFAPNPVILPDEAIFTVDTGTAATGSYTIDVVGIGGPTVHTGTVQLDVVAGTLAAPALIALADGVTDAGTLPTFTWAGVSGADGYAIQVATDSSFSNIVASATGLSSPSYTLAGALSAETVYYWRVNAANTCAQSDWSAIFSFVAAGSSEYNYSTLNGGYGIAWHSGNGETYLGPVWGTAGGVIRSVATQWTPGAEIQFQINAHSDGFLAAWFDWNNDGLFQDTEQEIAYTIAGAGVIDLSVTIPATEGYVTGQDVNARFRFYATEPLLAPSVTETFDGFGGDGEVEDYSWTFSPTVTTVRGFIATRNASGGLLAALTLLVALAIGGGKKLRGSSRES